MRSGRQPILFGCGCPLSSALCRHGHVTRKGNAVALMQQVVAKLTQDDMIALAAYVTSQNP